MLLQPEHMMSQAEERPSSIKETTLSQVKVFEGEWAPDDEISVIVDVWNAATTWFQESPYVLIIASSMSVIGCCMCAQILLASSKES